jgi:hypothetical protein
MHETVVVPLQCFPQSASVLQFPGATAVPLTQMPVLSVASGSTPKLAAPAGIVWSFSAACVGVGGFGGVVVLMNWPPSKTPPVPLHEIGVVWVALVRQPEGFAPLLPQSKREGALLSNPIFPSSSRNPRPSPPAVQAFGRGVFWQPGLQILARPTPPRESARRGEAIMISRLLLCFICVIFIHCSFRVDKTSGMATPDCPAREPGPWAAGVASQR